jgi:hypothetical protein
MMRQFDSLDHVPRELSALIEPTLLRAKIGEFLRPGAGAGVGSPLFVWAPITSSPCLGEGTWHAFEVLVGQRPGVAILVAVNEAECPVHAYDEDLLGGAVCAAMLLLSPHFAILFIPLAVCLADFLWRERAALVGIFLALILLLGVMTAKDVVGRATADRFLAHGSLTASALLALLATVWILPARRRTARC